MDILIKKFIDELPTEATIKSDLEKCTKAFNDNLDKLKEIGKAIRGIILGEAPQNFENYFYNSKGNKSGTAFLSPTSINGVKDQEELIEYLNSKGVIVIDLFPLPLPTYYYTSTSFYKTDKNCIKVIEEYWNKIIETIKIHNNGSHESIVLGVRYKKITQSNKNGHKKMYNQFIDKLKKVIELENQPLELWSDNMPVNTDKLKELIKNLIE